MDFRKGRASWCPSAPFLNNENDLSQVITEMSRRVRSLKLYEFFLCDFDKNAFLSALQNITQAILNTKMDEFTKLDLFSLDPFKVLQEHLIEKLAHGPERRQVTLKQPDSAIFFMHLNHQN